MNPVATNLFACDTVSNIYVVADIHGEYDLLLKLLKQVNFGGSDTLIIVGDMIDKGVQSVKVVQLLRKMPNAFCVLGNHEYDFLKFYHALIKTDDVNYDKVLFQLQQRFVDGTALCWEDIDWLDALPTHLEFENFIVAHSGLPQDASGHFLPIATAPAEAFVYNRFFASGTCLPQGYKCCLFGHTPTRYISGKDEILFYPRASNLVGSPNIIDYVKIHLDTGIWLNGKLGCLRVNDLETFYVNR